MIFFLSLNYLFIYILFFENLKDFFTKEIIFLLGLSYCLTAIIQVCINIFYTINKWGRDTKPFNEEDEVNAYEAENEKIAREYFNNLDVESLKEFQKKLSLISDENLARMQEEQIKKFFGKSFIDLSSAFEFNYDVSDLIFTEKLIFEGTNFEYYWEHSNSISILMDIEFKKISRFIKIKSEFRFISFLNHDFNLCIFLKNFLKKKEKKMVKYISKIENYDAATIDYLLESEEKVLIWFEDIFLILILFGDDFKVKKIIFSNKFV